ncbi:hypothetical protein [Massilia oculi]|uniref:hypothetical protein n=1 Tax=Massilia oculi TaxID=945844 RepID=UPI0013B4563C|nr:hypothetical protein [Massilia oculi]
MRDRSRARPGRFESRGSGAQGAMLAASVRRAVAVLNERFDDSAPFVFGGLDEIDHLVLEADAPLAAIASLRERHPALDITLTNKAPA